MYGKRLRMFGILIALIISGLLYTSHLYTNVHVIVPLLIAVAMASIIVTLIDKNIDKNMKRKER